MTNSKKDRRQVVAYLGISLDGFIATLDERVDWLEAVEGDGDNGYGDFYGSIDTVIMGRKTYDWIAQKITPYPYLDKVNYVLTRKARPTNGTVTFTDVAVGDLISQLKQQDGKDIWICGGGRLVSSLLDEGLIDHLRLTVAPIILGQGISLYQDIVQQQVLHLTDTHRHGQFVELIYQVK